MKTYIMPKGIGSTTTLICESERTQIPILCATGTSAQYIREKAAEMGCSIPYPMWPRAFNLPQFRDTKFEKFLVDEADSFLETFVKKLSGADIEAITMSMSDERASLDDVDDVIDDFSKCAKEEANDIQNRVEKLVVHDISLVEFTSTIYSHKKVYIDGICNFEETKENVKIVSTVFIPYIKEHPYGDLRCVVYGCDVSQENCEKKKYSWDIRSVKLNEIRKTLVNGSKMEFEYMFNVRK